MGSACCKNTDLPTRASPHLPFSEVVRRCARILCPVDPPVQKPAYRPRKYHLSDIVGPVVKKDSWVQTDPLPPPRRRKRKEKQRKRSRSVEFLPYLIRQDDSRISGGSLEDIPGQEDALDFQMYFMGRLPHENSNEEGKESVSDKKKEFLSGLLCEENNNLFRGEVPKVENLELLQKSSIGVEKEQSKLESSSNANSRRSSITESLREFESSLLEMLDEEEGSIGGNSPSAGKDDDDDVVVTSMIPVRKQDLPPLVEEKEEDYIITPVDEDLEDRFKEEVQNKLPPHGDVRDESNKDLKGKTNVYEVGSLKVTEIMPSNIGYRTRTRKDQPPIITVEIVS